MTASVASPPAPAVFLDRDGTINVDHGYVYRCRDLELIAGAGEAIARLNRRGIRVIVVTNQSGVARGFFEEGDVVRFHEALRERLADCGAQVDALFYCPHHPDGVRSRYALLCDSRKPGIGMYRRACDELRFDEDCSWMVGDQRTDMTFARRASLKGLLLAPGLEVSSELKAEAEEGGFEVVPDLSAAVSVILGSHVD